jgi:hypothetical protein
MPHWHCRLSLSHLHSPPFHVLHLFLQWYHLCTGWPKALVGGNDVGSGTLGSSIGTVMLIGVGKGEPFCVWLLS